MAKILTLSSLRLGKMLVTYVSTSDIVISAILIKEEGKERQIPNSLIGHILIGPKLNHSNIEKMVLVLITTTMELRPYFEAHTIRVLTDEQHKKMVQMHDYSRRMLLWVVELSRFEIEYNPRTAVKS